MKPQTNLIFKHNVAQKQRFSLVQSFFCCAAKQTVLATALLIPIMHLSERRYEREGNGWKIDWHSNKWQAARLSAHSGRPSQGGTGKWTRQRRRGRHRGGHEEGTVTSCYPESYKKGRFTQQLGHAEKKPCFVLPRSTDQLFLQRLESNIQHL